jgi:hypothetical protein
MLGFKKLFLLLPLALLLTGTIRAGDLTFTITKNPDIGLNSGDSHTEEVWNFTTLAGWSQGLIIDSVEITETFSGISGGSQFQSTFIAYTPTLGNLGTQPRSYVIFPAETPTVTETVTESGPFPCCTDSFSESFSAANLTGNGVLGQFDTRVARNSGSFTIDSLSMTITAEAPEPATFGLIGLGLVAMVGIRRRFRA